VRQWRGRRIVIQINPIAAISVGVQRRRVAHVVNLVVHDLVARRRENGVSSIDSDRSPVVHDSLQQVVDVIEGDDVVGVADAGGHGRIGDALGSGDGAMVAIVNVIVRVQVVVSHPLADSEGGRNGAAITLHDVVLHDGRLRFVGVGVRLEIGRDAIGRRRPIETRNELETGSGRLGDGPRIERDVLTILKGDRGADVGLELMGNVAGRRHDVIVMLEGQSSKRHVPKVGGDEKLREDSP